MKTYQIARVIVIAALVPVIAPSSPALAQQPAAIAAVTPHIVRFDLNPPTRLVPGATLHFRLTGTPDGNATVRVDGVKGKIFLREVTTGIYEGAYTLTAEDKVVGDSTVIGNLSVGSQERSTVLADPLVQTLPIVA